MFRRAKTRPPKDVKKHVDVWKSGSGALVLCLVTYYDGAEIQAFQYVHSPCVSQLHPLDMTPSVESAPAVGNSFTHACPNWKEGTHELFKDWTAKQFADPSSEGEAEEGEVSVEYKKAKDISFKRNNSSELILPQ